MASGPVMKILNWILRIIGLGIVLGVFGWLIYDIFFQGEEVKARVLIRPLFLLVRHSYWTAIHIGPITWTAKMTVWSNRTWP